MRDETGKIVMVSYQRRFEPSVQQMKQIITEGGIGDVEFVTAQLHQSWYTNNLGRIQRTGESWRVHPAAWRAVANSTTPGAIWLTSCCTSWIAHRREWPRRNSISRWKWT